MSAWEQEFEDTLVVLENSKGTRAVFTTYGATLLSFRVPAKGGEQVDIVVNYPSLKALKEDSGRYLGATVGRFANRIEGATFILNGKEHTLDQNNGENCLHGGNNGLNRRMWAVEERESTRALFFVEEEEGIFPGTLKVWMEVQLSDNDELSFAFKATTDAPTYVSLTNHSYFNLHGDPTHSVEDIMMEFFADFYTPINENFIPTGEVLTVKGTPFDFKKPTAIGTRIKEDNEQLKIANGYDINFVLSKHHAGELTLASRSVSLTSLVCLDVYTTSCGLQFFVPSEKNAFKDKYGRTASGSYAYCLEPQYFPDSPNIPHFPSALLNPGSEYKQKIVLKAYLLPE